MSTTTWKAVPDSNYLIPIGSSESLANIINCLLECCLFHINSIPNGYDKMLDLVFVSDSFEFSVFRHTPVANPDDQYHPSLEIKIFQHPFRQANTLTQTPFQYN